jgi:hypothetical protein
MKRVYILKTRPEIQFDVENQGHRLAFANFLRNRAWGDSPRFYLEEGYSCIPEMIKDKLLHYYINKEFN